MDLEIFQLILMTIGGILATTAFGLYLKAFFKEENKIYLICSIICLLVAFCFITCLIIMRLK